MGRAVPVPPLASRPPSHPSAVRWRRHALRLAHLLPRGHLVGDHERQRREEQFTAVLDRPSARGVLADTQRLRPARAARTVRCWAGGDITITDGPAAQPGEQLTGWAIA